MEPDFEKLDGLLPAIVQDYASREILMLGFMNREALAETLRSGDVTFYSRSRKKLWKKGEQSGHRLRVCAPGAPQTLPSASPHDKEPCQLRLSSLTGRVRALRDDCRCRPPP
jgi:hypothetical protein